MEFDKKVFVRIELFTIQLDTIKIIWYFKLIIKFWKEEIVVELLV